MVQKQDINCRGGVEEWKDDHDIERAWYIVSYHPERSAGSGRRVPEVVAVIMMMEMDA